MYISALHYIRSHGTALALLTVSIAAHLAALALALSPAATPTPLPSQPPSIQGMLIKAPPAETVSQPASRPPAAKTPAKQQPEKKPPEKPMHRPKRQHEPLATAARPAAAKPAPAEPAQHKPPVPPQPDNNARPDDRHATDSKADSSTSLPPASTAGAPVVLPRHDASHLNNPQPAYPSVSRRLGEQGIVELAVLIEADGRVSEVRLKKSCGHRRLDRSAIKAVKRWRYVPAQQAGRAIAHWHTQAIEFSLN